MDRIDAGKKTSAQPDNSVVLCKACQLLMNVNPGAILDEFKGYELIKLASVVNHVLGLKVKFTRPVTVF